MDNLQDVRKTYELSHLHENQLHQNPFEQFSAWIKDAMDSPELEASAMALSTVDDQGKPHSRMVLLKDFSDSGFVFFSNYESDKSVHIQANNAVSILFFWQHLERQVRIEGIVEKIADIESDAYFKSRPIEHKLGTWASPQSKVIPSANFLEEQYLYFKEKFKQEIPRPPHWGGYVVKPSRFEFWQGRPSRLHDRIIFSLQNNEWKIERVAP
ncbi:MAG: pyridoxamine 5'-phosphate oxidase [Paludibacteraceae bacterium]|nr:pyridoxamine 5'-phosphate oxidase [Paludibacteraceae bacterium]